MELRERVMLAVREVGFDGKEEKTSVDEQAKNKLRTPFSFRPFSSITISLSQKGDWTMGRSLFFASSSMSTAGLTGRVGPRTAEGRLFLCAWTLPSVAVAAAFVSRVGATVALGWKWIYR